MNELINGNGIAYYGLGDVYGGKLWFVCTPDGVQYYGTKNRHWPA